MFINVTESIGQIIVNGTTNITGNIVATMFLILMTLIVIGIMFQIPLEFISIFILPFCLAIGAYYGTFMVPIIIILIYVSMIMAKNWLFR